MERTLERNEKAYKNMIAVAKMLEAVSENNAKYEVEDVYLDFGQDWMWTTICRKGGMFGGCQILNPKEWREIVLAENASELVEAVNNIRNGKYFSEF